MFTVGQKVRCIGMNLNYSGKLTIGQVYTIIGIDKIGTGCWVWVKEGPKMSEFDARGWNYQIQYFSPMPTMKRKTNGNKVP